jgi:hypothetical protein
VGQLAKGHRSSHGHCAERWAGAREWLEHPVIDQPLEPLDVSLSLPSHLSLIGFDRRALRPPGSGPFPQSEDS